MSQVTTFKCDFCGAECTDRSKLGLQVIAVGIKSYSYGSFTPNFNLFDPVRTEKDACKDCLERFGFIAREKPDTELPPPSLEDMIRNEIK